jgi:hypothetical protein
MVPVMHRLGQSRLLSQTVRWRWTLLVPVHATLAQAAPSALCLLALRLAVKIGRKYV